MGKKITILFDGERFNASSEEILEFSNLRIDIDRQKAYMNKTELDLTNAQFNLLTLLAKNQGKALSREYIAKHTEGISPDSDSRSIDVMISHIRYKLKGGIEEPFIKTIHSIGYIFWVEKEYRNK